MAAWNCSGLIVSDASTPVVRRILSSSSSAASASATEVRAKLKPHGKHQHDDERPRGASYGAPDGAYDRIQHRSLQFFRACPSILRPAPGQVGSRVYKMSRSPALRRKLP